MNLAGWAIMIVSIGSVCALSAFCFYRLLMLPPRELLEHEKAPLDIDTRDTDESR
ncbi:hypothetical protein [Lacipirellula parvula]|uniref:Uncharacterized protein n=1 Tax=Lacipirellula parvula TaxID=2650471 RepID=A0A5K7X9Y8_9BACT|nr:hypothetical protein [Lacipirellula parvula]BBO33215.1 hypothetical protein PLANPX_2827 [Lacipirellula parvula]